MDTTNDTPKAAPAKAPVNPMLAATVAQMQTMIAAFESSNAPERVIKAAVEFKEALEEWTNG